MNTQEYKSGDGFRPATTDDLPAVAELYLRCAKEGRKNGTSDWDDGYPSLAFAQEDLARDGLYVLEQAGRIIAVISLMNSDEELDALPCWKSARACALARLGVEPALQGKGVGAQMMGHILQCAKDRGYEATRHLAACDNPAAVRLYEKLGFSSVGRTHMYDIDFLCFEKTL